MRLQSSKRASRISSTVVKSALFASALAVVLAPGSADACACGCGIFDVGAQSLPENTELLAYFRYSYMNQNANWEGTSKAPAIDNGDKWINTSFYTVGADYVLNDNWMVMGELPVFARQLETTDNGGVVTGVNNEVYTGHLTDLGDAQLQALYTGLSSDMSRGLVFGIKLPTGYYSGPYSALGGQ